MIKKFHAPVTRFTICKPEIMAAIEALVAATNRPSCLRLDVFVSFGQDINLTRESLTLFEIPEDGHARFTSIAEMPSGCRGLFLEVLGMINEDCEISESLESYPLPWHDDIFLGSMKNRYLSLLFPGGGVASVIQEYLPNWIQQDCEDDYFGAAVDATHRAELMSVFLPEDSGNHRRLELEAEISRRQAILDAMFRHHADGAIDAELAPINPCDTF